MPATSQESPAVDLSAQHEEFLKRMQDKAAAYFRDNECEVDKNRPHILKSREQWSENIILPEVIALLKERKLNNKFHEWIFNGLSSQAMLFNLVGPLVKRNGYEPLNGVLRSKGILLPEGIRAGEFEYENHNVLGEDKKHPTSIDFVLLIDSKPALFIEAKFKEREFGGCSKFRECDCRKANPLNNSGKCFYNSNGMHYWELSRKHNIFDEGFRTAKECPFTRYYQFFREVLFAVEHRGYFVLLYDNRNPFFVNQYSGENQGIFTVLKSGLPEDIRQNIFAVSVQELFRVIKRGGKHNDWIGKFAAKYDLTDWPI